MSMDKAHEVLKDIFGFASFRLSQEAVIHRLIVQKENALVLFPTGGGKSLIYQVPALCLEGLTLVISPLIALMKDQVDVLVSRGVKAASLDSTLDAETARFVKNEVLSGSLKILYVAPERLQNESFMAMMKRVKISMLAVDESHCISQWGASFRPEYLKIARFAQEYNVERVLCLTATATKSVTEDICKSFNIHPTDGLFKATFYRSNLILQVQVAHSFKEKLDRLVPLLTSRTGPAIIYVSLQKQAEELAAYLVSCGLEAMVYHAGLPNDQRARVQVQFMQSEKGIVCATIAFGMGIDKANIRQIIHFNMSKNLESYSQEVGRAGRDNLPSTCLMFLSSQDVPTLESFARGDTCSKHYLEQWLQEVANKDAASDGTLDFNHYQQCKTYDIRSNVLNLLYAQLELDYGYIRAVTPCYTVYDIAPRTPDGWQAVLKDNSPAAQIIREHWKAKGSGHQIDVVVASTNGWIDRYELARQISTWELDGLIFSKGSQVRARYTLLKPLPKDAEEIKKLADQLYERMLSREDEAVRKLGQVVELATGDDCIAYALSSYFGDDDAVPGGLCGKCTFCTTGEGVSFPFTLDTATATTVPPPDPHRIQAILEACPERDDPRLLARMAFGITSPRLTAGRWSTSHPLFGSMVDVSFTALVRAFEEECKTAGYTRTDVVQITVSTTASGRKRAYGQAESGGSGQGSGYGSYGQSSYRGRSNWRGGGSKRGRYR